jgi:hypothetical protein
LSGSENASYSVVLTPNRDFIGANSVQVELETGDNKTPTLSFLINVEATAGK